MAKKAFTPPKSVHKKYWFGNIFIRGVGVVNGEVREDHLAKFKAQFKAGCAASELPDRDIPKLDLDYYIRDKDYLVKEKK